MRDRDRDRGEPREARDAARELAALVADAAATRRAGAPAAAPTERVRELVAVMLGAGDARASTTFFSALDRELRARGTTLPVPRDLDAVLAALLGPLGDLDAEDPDLDALATRLEDTVARSAGLPDRAERERADARRIDRDVAAHIAASMRRHGLTPAEDLPDD